jgi:deoxycytidylate deaminase
MVLAIVAPVGVDLTGTEEGIRGFFGKARFEVRSYRLSDCIREYVRLRHGRELPTEPECERIDALIEGGNEIRRDLGFSAVADLAVAKICQQRPDGNRSIDGCVHVLVSLKNPAEVAALRSVYGPALYVIGVGASDVERAQFLSGAGNMPLYQARRIIERDEREQYKYGQQTRETFHLADVYLRSGLAGNARDQIERFLRLTFGDPRLTPSRDEHGMFLEYAASARSASLARQVGAAIVDPRGDLVSSGCNDLPRFGGGLTWQAEVSADSVAQRYDPNDAEKNRLLVKVMLALTAPTGAEDSLSPDQREALISAGRAKLQDSGLLDLTEFGTDVHAEMEAILSAARRGAQIRDCTLFTTTFPCHNCAKHIVAAGVRRVVYIEPYPKSRAIDLLPQWITLDPDDARSKVLFEPLVGVGPRRFFDLYSLVLGTGMPLERKNSAGTALEWRVETARMRTPFIPLSYMQRETAAIERLNRLLHSDASLADVEKGND